MANPNTPYPINDYLIERPDPEALPQFVMCVEDRPTLLRGLNYWQWAGGIDGIGRDAATAMEVTKPNSFVDLKIPIHRMGAIAAALFETKNIQGLMHQRCAAYAAALAVRHTIISQQTEVFGQLNKMAANVTETEYEQISEASQRIVDNDLILPIEESDVDHAEGVEDMNLRPIPKLEIVHGDHKANDMIIDYETDSQFDTRSAYEDGKPAYFAGIGISRLVHKKFEDQLPFDYDTFAKSSIVRLAGISLKLPNPNGNPLAIHTRGEWQ
jgi:hypothetical protein